MAISIVLSLSFAEQTTSNKFFVNKFPKHLEANVIN
jgi:hypothetical protein